MVRTGPLPPSSDGDPAPISGDVERLRGKLATLCAIRGGPAGSVRVIEAKLAAFEAKHGLRLPPAYRAYLLVCGDAGAGFPDGGFKKLAARKRMGQPFPLDGPWIEDDREISDDAADLDDLEGSPKEWMRALPQGARPDDGCLVLGTGDDGCPYLLVLAGPHAGEVWVDGRGYGAGPVYPAGFDARDADRREVPAQASGFLAVQERWLDEQLVAARLIARVAEAIDRGGPGEFAVELDASVPDAESGRTSVVASVRQLAASRLETLLNDPSPDPDRCRDLAAWLLACEPGISERLLAGRALAASARYQQMLSLARAQQAEVDVSVPLRACIDVHALVAELALGTWPVSPGPAIDPACRYFTASPRPLARALERTGALNRFADLAPAWLLFEFVVAASQPPMDLVERALDGVLAPFVSDTYRTPLGAAHLDALFALLRRTPPSPERSRACAAFLGVFGYYETALRAQGYEARYLARLAEPLKDMGEIHEATTDAIESIARAWLEPRREHLLSIAHDHHPKALQRR